MIMYLKTYCFTFHLFYELFFTVLFDKDLWKEYQNTLIDKSTKTWALTRHKVQIYNKCHILSFFYSSPPSSWLSISSSMSKFFEKAQLQNSFDKLLNLNNIPYSIENYTLKRICPPSFSSIAPNSASMSSISSPVHFSIVGLSTINYTS